MFQKDFPVLYNRKEDCCGCSACYSVCPKSAISMKPDEEGFVYPCVDRSNCSKCYLCVLSCPMKKQNHSSENIVGELK